MLKPTNYTIFFPEIHKSPIKDRKRNIQETTLWVVATFLCYLNLLFEKEFPFGKLCLISIVGWTTNFLSHKINKFILVPFRFPHPILKAALIFWTHYILFVKVFVFFIEKGNLELVFHFFLVTQVFLPFFLWTQNC